MIHQQGIQISVLAGVRGAEFECFQPQGSGHSEVIRSEAGTKICPRLTITPQFQWYGADTLSVEVQFGTAKALQPIRMVKPADGQAPAVDLDWWVVWSSQHNDWRNAAFKFCDIEVCSVSSLTFKPIY